MTYEEQKNHELLEKYFRDTNENYSHACLTVDKICEQVANENKGACYKYKCIPLLEQSYIGKIITNEQDLGMFWYLASQRLHEKQDKKKKKEMALKGFYPASELSEQLKQKDTRYIIYMDEGIMPSYVECRTKHFANGDVWAIIKGKRQRGWNIDQIINKNYLTKID